MSAIADSPENICSVRASPVVTVSARIVVAGLPPCGFPKPDSGVYEDEGARAMAPEFLSSEEPKDIWVRATRAVKLLLLITALVVLDTFNRLDSIDDSYDKLPSALYDFTAKYKEPLVKWAPGATTQDVVIPFEKKYDKKELTPGYYDLTDVPLLEAYLRDRIPAFAPTNRRFFGYEMALRNYAVVAIYFPTALLFYLVWNLVRLKRIWLSRAPVSPRFMNDLPFFRSSKIRAVGILKALIGIAMLCGLAFVAPVALWMQFADQPALKGKLYVEPLGLPIIESGRGVLRLPADPWFSNLYGLLLMADIGAFAAILWILLRKKRSARAT
jgi:hypothetical protein